MNARRHANRMLWTGAFLVGASAVFTPIVRRLMSATGPGDASVLAIISPIHSLLAWVLACGCAFIAVSFPTRALHGRQVSIRHRRPQATPTLIIGIGCIVVGLTASHLIAGLREILMLTNTGQDLLLTVGPSLFPLFSQAIPLIGAVFIPASFLQRIIERGATTHERIFSGPAVD